MSIPASRTPPFPVTHELPGWELAWFELDATTADAARVAACRKRVAAEARAAASVETLGEDAVVAACRRLFRAAGCDPTRYRPSSEALLRRVLKGEELPAIHPLVDLNNCLSVALRVPSCVVRAEAVEPPVVFRAGRTGEVLDSMRGPLNLEGKPLLADSQGPFGTPITDGNRVKVLPETRRALLVAYLPPGLVSADVAAETLRRLGAEAGVAVT